MARNKSATVVDLDSEESIGEVGVAGKVVPANSNRRTGVTRKDPSEHPPCAHCGGKMHWNQAAATINFECLWRQFCLSQGTISDPNDRLPLFTDADVPGMLEWINTRKRSRKNPLRYGKMEAPGGGFGTYSALKASEAKEAKSASEIAGEEDESARSKKQSKKAKAEPLITLSESKGKKKGKKAAAPVEAPKSNKTGKLSKTSKPKKVKAAPITEPEFDLDDLEIIEDDEPTPVKARKSGKTSKLSKAAKMSTATVVKGKKSKTGKKAKAA
jgi:hypothetical protein